MARKPTEATPPAGADAAASFADGHVDLVRPVAQGAEAIDPLAAERERDKAGLIRDVLDPGQGQIDDGPLDGFILVTCAKPGFRRAGMAHPIRAEYSRDSFTQAQIDALQAEPMITFVAIGGDPIPRASPLFGDVPSAVRPRDPVLAGMAAADAISRPPNRAEPGLRNAGATRF